jgi:hypothetical protein
MRFDIKALHRTARVVEFDEFFQLIKSQIANQPMTVVIPGELQVDIELIKPKRKLSPDMFTAFEVVVGCFDKKFYKEKLWLECYDKLIRLDKYTEKQILYIVQWGRKEGNWWHDNGNFNTLLKLRKLNDEKIKYIDVFKEKIKAEYAKNRKGFSTGNIIHKDDGKKREY